MTTILGNIGPQKNISKETNIQINPVKSESQDIYLTVEERLKIQLLLEKRNNVESNAGLLSIKIQSLNLMNQNFDMKKTQIMNDIKSINKQIEDKKAEHNNINKEYNELLEIVTNKYNLGKDWEFDNNTGKIIKDGK